MKTTREQAKTYLVAALKALLEANENENAAAVSATGTSLFGAEEWASASNAAAQTVALLPTARFAPSQQAQQCVYLAWKAFLGNGDDDSANEVDELGRTLWMDEGWALQVHRETYFVG